MRISHRYKFVFFSSPKTGSESVRAFLDPYTDISGRKFFQVDAANPFHTHMRPIEVQAEFLSRGWQFNAYYRFVFIRNPWARLYSLYKMICTVERGFGQPFAEWLQSTRPDGTGGVGGGVDEARWRKYGTYSIESFAGNGSGKLLVDDVFRLEDISKLPNWLREKGLPIPTDAPIPWINRGPEPVNLRRYYTSELIDLVAKRYAGEIARFNYTFPG